MENIEKEKRLGQIFTPKRIVDTMLDEIGFSNIKVMGLKIMEPAFGKGIFLIEIIKRIIREGRTLNYTDKQIENAIENNVYGIEIDKELFNETINSIKNLLKDNNLNASLDFKLYNNDTIKIWKEFENKFDIVIGNPPYIRTKNLDLETRNILKDFKFSTGLQDIYLCFIELSYRLLNKDGKLVFITPTAWFNTKYAGKFRNFLQISKSLKTLILLDLDYKPFKKSVDTCIFTIQKGIKTDTTIYRLTKTDLYLKENIKLEEIKFNDAFVFKANKKILEIMKRGFKKEKFKVSSGLGTLKDEFYLRDKPIGNSLFIKSFKGSTNKYYWLFFPYNEKGKLLSLEEIKEKNAEMYKNLLENKEILSKRSLDYRQKWWSFGRAQGIQNIFKEKYGINNLFLTQKTINLEFLGKNVALNAGYYILTDVKYEKIKYLIFSDTFIEYAKTFGSLKNGNFFTLSTKQIELFLNTFYELVYN